MQVAGEAHGREGKGVGGVGCTTHDHAYVSAPVQSYLPDPIENICLGDWPNRLLLISHNTESLDFESLNLFCFNLRSKEGPMLLNI